jgi:hypothetical protein
MRYGLVAKHVVRKLTLSLAVVLCFRVLNNKIAGDRQYSAMERYRPVLTASQSLHVFWPGELPLSGTSGKQSFCATLRLQDCDHPLS